MLCFNTCPAGLVIYAFSMPDLNVIPAWDVNDLGMVLKLSIRTFLTNVKFKLEMYFAMLPLTVPTAF